ncbi:nucleotidyltransferase family protein [Primorskyibacter aestuariivivens]|uniref:nucleotidyltransferase family protein n=1 Tax=Primorskyibacter aestuariivivens TaxID=1888912 RepID=UPI002301BB5F|nr:nucleotidyltransferase family protein [Primorskyibacter aestuariivivens]MDA7427646.1 nucleotidyltransferase family protein [Primorskyibacter aestuariivivens]
MTRPDAALLFAAGFGTRMRPLTDTRPKPLIEVAGQPLLDHALALVEPLGLSRVVVNTHYKGEMIAKHLSGRDIALSHEAPEVLETGGGLKQALPLLGEGPVFTLNTDAVWRGPNPLQMLADAWDPTRMDALLLCIPPQQAHGHSGAGDFLLGPEGRITRGPGLIYSGVQIIKPGGLHDIRDTVFSLWSLWQPMLEAGRMFGLPFSGQWCDVGHPDGIRIAERMLSDV